MRKIFNPLLGAVGFVYVDACVGVGDGFGSWSHRSDVKIHRQVCRDRRETTCFVDCGNTGGRCAVILAWPPLRVLAASHTQSKKLSHGSTRIFTDSLRLTIYPCES